MADRQQSEFNMAVSYLNRLNILFYGVMEARANLDPHAWFHTLANIEAELSTEMKQTKEVDEVAEFKGRRESIKNLLDGNSRRNARTYKQEISSELYDALHDYELELRRVLKAAGLQTKMMKDPRLAL